VKSLSEVTHSFNPTHLLIGTSDSVNSTTTTIGYTFNGAQNYAMNANGCESSEDHYIGGPVKPLPKPKRDPLGWIGVKTDCGVVADDWPLVASKTNTMNQTPPIPLMILASFSLPPIIWIKKAVTPMMPLEELLPKPIPLAKVPAIPTISTVESPK
jgi:hypothetical protein